MIDKILSSDKFEFFFQKIAIEYISVLKHGYNDYYGDDYQYSRIINSNSSIYYAVNNGEIIGVSYIKSNLRRGATVIYPLSKRGAGIGKKLVMESKKDYPYQYSFLSEKNFAMITLLKNCGFKIAKTKEELKFYLNEFEINNLNEFKLSNENLEFTRNSVRRKSTRESLIFMYSEKIT